MMGAPTTFHDRLARHGKAEDWVRKSLAPYHVVVTDTGFQINRDAHTWLNQEWTRHDPVAEFMRHLPDFVTIPMCGRCTLADIKSKDGALPFSVECDSLHAALQLEWLGHPMYFTFVNTSTGSIDWVAAGDVPVGKIQLPFEFDRARMETKFPGSEIVKVTKSKKGSGTPFVWVNTSKCNCLTTRQFVEKHGAVTDESLGEALDVWGIA